MSAQKITYLIMGLVGGFLIGFFFANYANRSEQEKMRAELARLRSSGGGNASSIKPDAKGSERNAPQDAALTDEELRQAIASGDADPKDIDKQRKLGRGLYLYAMNSGKASILPDAVRMLRRAYEADPKDYETTVLLAQALFDSGQSGDAALIAESRKYFTKALEMKPDDLDVRTELGLTYFFDKPSNPQRAIQEFRRSLAKNPKHEMTLQSLAAALIKTGEMEEAQRRIDELQEVNSSNAALPNLRAQLAQAKNSAK